MSQVAMPTSISRGLSILDSVRRRARWALGIPVPASIVAVLAVRRFDPLFLENPILIVVLALFLAGQVAFATQIVRLLARLRREHSVLEVVGAAGTRPDIPSLREKVAALQASDTRDLVENWLDLALQGEVETGLDLLRNSSDRRSLQDQKRVGVHALVNRSVLKVGFLGTLVGLLFTFPPMKRAILGLSDSGGEMTFIRDIAKAIDEDAFAIQATLVATGLSLLIEAISVQVMESLFRGMELADTHLADWDMAVLRPTVRRALSPSAALDQERTRSDDRLAQAQKQLDAHIDALLSALRRTGEAVGRTGDVVSRVGDSVESVAKAQTELAKRVDRIVSWEGDYRRFIAAKRDSIGPSAPSSVH